jgi:hypothetical protein
MQYYVASADKLLAALGGPHILLDATTGGTSKITSHRHSTLHAFG